MSKFFGSKFSCNLVLTSRLHFGGEGLLIDDDEPPNMVISITSNHVKI